ncbi:hypothetical protein HK101_009275, partial [Irineochytrium annulatum]
MAAPPTSTAVFFDYPRTDTERHQAFRHLSFNSSDAAQDPAVAVMSDFDVMSDAGTHVGSDVYPYPQQHQLVYDKHGGVVIDPSTGMPLAIAAPGGWSVAHGEGVGSDVFTSGGERTLDKRTTWEDGAGADKTGKSDSEPLWKVWKWQ